MSFTASHISQSQTIHLSAPPSQVFPLFEPVGEQSWSSDWKPTFLFPASGTAQAGMVFTTQVHDGESDTIWTMTVYDPASFNLEYLRVTPGSRVAFIDIRCTGTPDGTTEATITYSFTGLSDQGNEFIATITPAHYEEFIRPWEAAMNHYLRYGQPLAHH